jgi:alpha-mannosidase
VGVPTWKDELYFEYHRGIFTTQAAHKRDNRRSEAATLDAEKFASMAWLEGRAYPAQELTESWKKITFNQFHDLAAGSGIAVIYRDAQTDYAEVFRSDRAIATGAQETLAARVDTRVARGVPVVVYNSLAWPRSEDVTLTVRMPEAAQAVKLLDAQDRELISQVVAHDAGTNTFTLLARVQDIPALGYAVLHAEPARPRGDEEVNGATDRQVSVDGNPSHFLLANAHLKVTIDRTTGCITSLVSLPAGTEFLAPGACGNQLQTFKDTPKQYDAWNIDPGTLDGAMTPVSQVDSVAVLAAQDGALRHTVRVQRTWQGSHFTQDISLDAGSDIVRIENDIDWHEKHVLLKAAFPLAHSSAKATFEIPYGSIERPTTRDNSWEKAKFEVPALRWADLGDAQAGVSILNDSKYGYDAVGNVLRLTLLRSPTWPDADADQGRQHFVYAIYPHAGGWKQAQTMRRGYELNDPLTAVQAAPHTGSMPAAHSFAAVENANVTLTAVKKAEDADALVFRMVEWAGTASEVKLHVPPGAAYAVESNLMEKVEGPHLAMASDVVSVPIKPYEILTVQVFYPAHAMVAAK